MKNFIMVLLLFLISSLVYAANLTSCVSPSLVTCPAGAVVHNVGTCPNGFVLWGCQYPNGTVVSTALPNSTATTIATTASTSIPTSAPTTISASNTTIPSTVSIPTTTTIPKTSLPSSNFTMLIYFSIAIIIVIILILYYVLVSRKRA